jgi:hypothetical protein
MKFSYDAHRDRLTDLERIADRQHHIADLQAFGAAEGNCRQPGHCDLEHRKIGFRISADEFGFDASPTGQTDRDFFGSFDHVIVGEHVAIGGRNHAGAGN